MGIFVFTVFYSISSLKGMGNSPLLATRKPEDLKISIIRDEFGMRESTYIHMAHNVSVLLYHIVTPTKYRRLAINEVIESSLKQICEGIELRWDWIRFLEIGADKDHVHYLVQSTPEHSPTEIVRLIKSVTARRIFAEHPEVKKLLWGGEFWSDGYFVSTVGKFTSENVIAEYVKNQGNESNYKQLYLNFTTETPSP